MRLTRQITSTEEAAKPERKFPAILRAMEPWKPYSSQEQSAELCSNWPSLHIVYITLQTFTGLQHRSLMAQLRPQVSPGIPRGLGPTAGGRRDGGAQMMTSRLLSKHILDL